MTILTAICFSSCTKNKRWESAAEVVKEWTGKEIKFPKELSCTYLGRDTTCIDLYSDNYKILLYVDSLGCTSCRLKLFEWKKLMKESDTAFVRKPEFVFIFQPKKRDEQELHTILRSNGFRHPVFIDEDNTIDKLSNFPANTDYQCFLLDRDNKVLMIGNPSFNTGIWILYKSIINARETGVITMEKGGKLKSFEELTTLPPRFPLVKKGGSKGTELI